MATEPPLMPELTWPSRLELAAYLERYQSLDQIALPSYRDANVDLEKRLAVNPDYAAFVQEEALSIGALQFIRVPGFNIRPAIPARTLLVAGKIVMNGFLMSASCTFVVDSTVGEPSCDPAASGPADLRAIMKKMEERRDVFLVRALLEHSLYDCWVGCGAQIDGGTRRSGFTLATLCLLCRRLIGAEVFRKLCAWKIGV